MSTTGRGGDGGVERHRRGRRTGSPPRASTWCWARGASSGSGVATASANRRGVCPRRDGPRVGRRVLRGDHRVPAAGEQRRRRARPRRGRRRRRRAVAVDVRRQRPRRDAHDEGAAAEADRVGRRARDHHRSRSPGSSRTRAARATTRQARGAGGDGRAAHGAARPAGAGQRDRPGHGRDRVLGRALRRRRAQRPRCTRA